MLNIYTGRENLDTKAFLFDEIEREISAGEHVILVVPDQYTLQGERDAFEYLKTDGFMDLEVLGFSRFAGRVFSETGGGNRTFIDQYGKFMLISKILKEQDNELEIFNGFDSSSDFVQKMNDMISELKYFNIEPEYIEEMIGKESLDPLLERKLADISRVYSSYENIISGKYIDMADQMEIFNEKIADSKLVQGSIIWIWGFDYLSPKNMDSVMELAKHSKNTSIILTAERGNRFFDLTNDLCNALTLNGKSQGIKVSQNAISQGEYEIDKSDCLKHLEKEYDSYPAKKYMPDGNDSDVKDSENKELGDVSDKSSDNMAPVKAVDSAAALELVEAANFYGEAETAAVKISQMIRDEGYRYKDILVICNDTDKLANVIKRVFSEYDIPLFTDMQKDVKHNPVLRFITALLDIAAEGLEAEHAFKLIKSGFTELSSDEGEELENYIIEFGIRGSSWKKDFFLTGNRSEEEMENLNRSRQYIFDLKESFKERFKPAASVKMKSEVLYDFLTEDIGIPHQLEEYIEGLKAYGHLEYAEEMSQIWDVVTAMFKQVIGVLGDTKISLKDYAAILTTGFETVKVGILPPSTDQVMLGTMQRTRSGNIKAMFVLGANDGILPASSTDEVLLNEDERQVLFTKGNVICKNDDQMAMEEQMAIYRNLSKPREYLSISYSVSDTGGNELRPSFVFERVKKIFPGIGVEKDVFNRDEDPIDLISSGKSTITHLVDAMREWKYSKEILPTWKEAYNITKERDSVITRIMTDGLNYENRDEFIDPSYVVELYNKNSEPGENKVVSSPSGMEKFSHCPFSFFMDRGISVKERRVFSIDSRYIGDLYHEVLMRYGRSMTQKGVNVSDSDSKWQSVTKEQCETMIEDIYSNVVEDYKDGMFDSGEYEKYKSRRLLKNTLTAAWAITEQVQAGKITDMLFETGFGERSKFPPIEYTEKNDNSVGNDNISARKADYNSDDSETKKLQIRGKIDRVDILEGNHAKIIDYKSGNMEFKEDDVKSGWQLQLMLYLKAVTKKMDPAGVFYLRIPEPRIDTTGRDSDSISSYVESELKKGYRLNGIAINDPQITDAIDGHNSGVEVAPKKSYVDKEKFQEISDTVDKVMENLSDQLLGGDISARPTSPTTNSGNKITACTYCNFKSICGYSDDFNRS